jgi:putative FmdB family regulatory protein
LPTYGYECTKCHEQFEIFQRITDDPLSIHEGCGGELRRMVFPVGIVFKGSGFYVNDYARKNKGENAAPKSTKETAPAVKPEETKPTESTGEKIKAETAATPASS